MTECGLDAGELLTLKIRTRAPSSVARGPGSHAGQSACPDGSGVAPRT
jgi:hypothetical protein